MGHKEVCKGLVLLLVACSTPPAEPEVEVFNQDTHALQFKHDYDEPTYDIEQQHKLSIDMGVRLVELSESLPIPDSIEGEEVGSVAGNWQVDWFSKCWNKNNGKAPYIFHMAGSPTIGKSITFSFDPSSDGYKYHLFVGSDTGKWQGLTLPWTIPNTNGCVIGINAEIVVPMGIGVKTMTFSIPNNLNIVGGVVYWQMLVEAPDMPGGFLTSRVFRMMIGN